MNVEKITIEDCLIIEPTVYNDDRGYFYEKFNARDFKRQTGVCFETKQINQSLSSKRVLRGLHYQKNPKAQAKLVSCLEGEILDVVVDIRKNSKTFGLSASVMLSGDNKKQIFIPKGIAHGFLVLSDHARVMYQADEFYSPEHDAGVFFNDPNIDIKWPFPLSELILSPKDRTLPTLKEVDPDF